MSKQYDKMIIEKLLNKYEKSKISKEGSGRKLSISFLFDEKNMPDYVNEYSYQYEYDIENAVNTLSEKGFIEIEYDYDKRIKKVKLVLDKIEDCYEWLNKKSVQKDREEIKSILEKYKGKGSLANWYVDKIMERIAAFKSTKHYFKNANDLNETLYVLNRLERQKEEISIRNFSAKVLKNSKRMEAIVSKIEGIINEYYDSDEEEPLLRYNVYKNPTFVYLRGVGRFKINEQVVDLERLNSELILSSHHIEKLEVLDLNCEEIVTIENLTTFYEYPIKNRCVIYLGGFHNEIRRKLLCKLYDFNKKIRYYHSGDIDAGGFYILNHLIEDTKIPFEARNMDIDTLIEYSNYTIGLTDRDKKRIKKLLLNERLKNYYDVLNYMLDNNVKIEQENINYLNVK